MNYQETIRELCAIAAPSGFETPVIDALEARVRAMGLSASRSALGNLIVHRPGSGRKLALVAHADTKGFVVLDRGENGFCRIGELGHFDALSSLVGTPVRFTNGARGIIGSSGSKDCKITDLFVNVLAGEVTLGDVCVPDLPFFSDGDLLASPALDNRAACAILLDVLARTETEADLFVVFSVQQALGARGAASALFDIQPDAVIVCECFPTSDVPGSELRSTVKLGEGPVAPVKVARGGAASMTLLSRLEQAMPLQRAVYPGGNSDLLSIQVAGAGVHTCAVGVPVRVYGATAVADVRDAAKVADVIVGAL